jgi:hypothetical protein
VQQPPKRLYGALAEAAAYEGGYPVALRSKSMRELERMGGDVHRAGARGVARRRTGYPPAQHQGETMMLDTTPITTELTKLITAGTTEQALLVAVARLFPELTPTELSQALQVATTAAERQAVRRH